MSITSGEVFEAEELLEKIGSWNNEEIEELPKLYRKKVEKYQKLVEER
jgi:hypothetical protein